MSVVVADTELEGLDPALHKSLREAILRQRGNPTLGKIGRDDDFSPVSQEVLSELFAQKLRELDSRFPVNTIQFVRRKYPSLYDRTNDADVNLSRVWSRCLRSELGIHDFKEALNEWFSAYWKCAEAMKKSNLREEYEYDG